MRIIVTVTFFACLGLMSTTAYGQGKVSQSEIDSLVTQLSWDSVGGECGGIWRVFPDGPAATRLIEIGKPATPQLLQALNDQERGVAGHLILTAIWGLEETVYYENWVEGNEIDVAYFIHVYNGLRWTDAIYWKNVNIRHTVDSADLARNAENWKRKLAGRI